MVTYDMRIAAVRAWLKEEIFTRFSAPTGADPKLLANDTAELVNKSLPSVQTMEQFDALLVATRDHLTVTARTRTLPTLPYIKDACRAAIGAGRHAPADAGMGACRPDPWRILETRVRNGEAISDHHLTPVGIDDVLLHTNLTKADLDPYIAAHLKEKTHGT